MDKKKEDESRIRTFECRAIELVILITRQEKVFLDKNQTVGPAGSRKSPYP